MYLVKVTGALVFTTKHASLNGSKLLIMARLDENYQPIVHAQAAVDIIGTGSGEIVVTTIGSSACIGNNKDHSVIDAAVVGVVDLLELNG